MAKLAICRAMPLALVAVGLAAVFGGAGVALGSGGAGPASAHAALTHVVSIRVDGSGRLDLSGGSASATLASVSPDRARIAFVRNEDLWVMNADGSGQRRVVAHEALEAFTDETFGPPAWSPDGRRLALSAVSTASCSAGETKCASWYVSVVDLQGTLQARLGWGRNAAWSPSGTRLAYEQGADGGFSLSPEATYIAVARADGSARRSLTEGIHHSSDECWAFPAWSPADRRVAFERVDCNTDRARALYVVPRTAGKRHVLPGASHPSWSPNGTALAFVRGTGRSAALVLAHGDGTATRKLATGAGAPVWSRDGSRIAFVSARTAQLWILDVRTRRLRQVTHEPSGSAIAALAFSRDGTRIFYTTEEEKG